MISLYRIINFIAYYILMHGLLYEISSTFFVQVQRTLSAQEIRGWISYTKRDETKILVQHGIIDARRGLKAPKHQWPPMTILTRLQAPQQVYLLTIKHRNPPISFHNNVKRVKWWRDAQHPGFVVVFVLSLSLSLKIPLMS